MKTQLTLLALVSAIISGCVSTDLENHESLFKNPDPQIEALHVQAYNYDVGNGVERDQEKANALYLQAAQAGDPRSMMNYAINRFYGDGTDSDPVDAFYWIDRARFLTQKTPDMKLKWRIRGFYDEVEKTLTAEQKKEAPSKK